MNPGKAVANISRAVAIPSSGGGSSTVGNGSPSSGYGLGCSGESDASFGDYLAFTFVALTNRYVLAIATASAAFIYLHHIGLLGLNPILATLLLILLVCVAGFIRVSLEGRRGERWIKEQRKAHPIRPQPTVHQGEPTPASRRRLVTNPTDVTVTATAYDLPRGELTAQRAEEYIFDVEPVTDTREVV